MVLTEGGMLRALRSRNYRLFFTGQAVSLIGTWTQRIAEAWLLYRLTGSAALLGLLGFAGQIPVFVFASFGGALADRISKHRLLVATQAASMLLAFTLAGLTLGGVITPAEIFVLAVLLGTVNAIDTPVRQSFLVELVDRRNLMNAIALNSSAFNSARMLGPAVAGILIAALGEGWCFLLNGLSFLAVLASLLAIRGLLPPPVRPRKSPFADMAEGLRFVRNADAIRTLLVLLGAMSFIGVPFRVVMPLFADRVFHGNAQTLGWLMGAAGAGALVAALTLARREGLTGLDRWIAAGGVAFGASLFGVGLSHSLPLSLALLVVTGFSMIVLMAGCNTLIQSLVPDHLRGRVMAMYAMMLMGMTPLGSLYTGTIAQHLGAPAAVAMNGIACVVVAAVFVHKLPRLRESARRLWLSVHGAAGGNGPMPDPLRPLSRGPIGPGTGG